MSGNLAQNSVNHDPNQAGQTTESIGTIATAVEGVIHSHWRQKAVEKGYTILGRVKDRYHLLMQCNACGAPNVVKLYVLMNNQPLCAGCLEIKKVASAAAAGLTFLRRDPEDRHYAFYKAACGHEQRRQIEFVTKIASGEVGLRCDICHLAIEQAEAAARGWSLVGPDDEGTPSYRMYRHAEGGCGHLQRVARANMQSGRFNCGECGEAWPAEPSYLYLMQFDLPRHGSCVKFGYSNDPESRLAHQLHKTKDVPSRILRTVLMQTGHTALRAEKKIHKHLKTNFPDAVVDRDVFAEFLKLKSEVYTLAVAPELHRLLDDVETRQRKAG